jgi:hypothetical protein
MVQGSSFGRSYKDRFDCIMFCTFDIKWLYVDLQGWVKLFIIYTKFNLILFLFDGELN